MSFRLIVAGVAAVAAPIVAVSQDVGPQQRIDMTGAIAGNETTASASDANPLHMVAGWNDYRPDTDCCRSGFALTLDGGNTWTGFVLRPPPGNQTAVEGDPMTAFDPRTGTLWAGAIAFSGNGGIYIARKDPGQDTFGPAVMAELGFVDKCWMAAGPRPGNPDTTRVYVGYNLGIIWSDDMGQTWTNPRSLGSGIGFLPRVGPDGEVYVAYWNFNTGMLMARSLDGGSTWTTHSVATRMDTWGTQDGSRFPGIFRVPPLLYLDVDENTGQLYACYFDTTNIVNGQRNVDLYFTTSTDRGATWTTPRVINQDADPPGDQFFPWLEVDSNGDLHIVMNDSRNVVQNDNTTNGMFDCYYMFSDDRGATWSEHRLTPQSWNSANDGVRGSGQFIGDYLGLAVGQNIIYPVYLDTHEGTSRLYTNVIRFGTSVSLNLIRVTYGERIAGNLQSIEESDDQYYEVQSDFFPEVTEPIVAEVQVRGDVAGSPPALTVRAEGRLNVPSGLTIVRLFNHDTGQWDSVGSFAIGNTETVQTVGIASPDPYIRDDGQIRLRLRTIVVTSFFADGFRVLWDHIEIEPN